MEILFYVALIMCGVYVILNIGIVARWWLDKLLIIPKALWKKIKGE